MNKNTISKNGPGKGDVVSPDDGAVASTGDETIAEGTVAMSGEVTIDDGTTIEAPAKGDCLREHVRQCVRTYFAHMGGHMPTDMYDTIIAQCELPLLQEVMLQSRGNISLAAKMLGINRSTLRRKLLHHGLE